MEEQNPKHGNHSPEMSGIRTEADCIIAERSCRVFIVFLLPKILRIL